MINVHTDSQIFSLSLAYSIDESWCVHESNMVSELELDQSLQSGIL